MELLKMNQSCHIILGTPWYTYILSVFGQNNRGLTMSRIVENEPILSFHSGLSVLAKKNRILWTPQCDVIGDNDDNE